MKGQAFLHTVKVIIGIEPPDSQTTNREKALIKKYARLSKKAVEIGVYEGVNTINILDSMEPEGTLYAIDPFFRGILGISYSKLIAERAVKKRGFSKKIQFIRKLSHEAVNDVPDELDFIFIDGDHSWDGISKDWKDWSKKVKLNRFIGLHDTSVPPHDPSVANLGSCKFFKEYIIKDPRFKLCETVDSLNILQRIE